MLQNKPFHPFLLCLYFVFFIFAENLGEVFLGEVIRPIAVLFLATVLLLMLFRFVFGNLNKSAVVTTLILALLFVHTGMEQLVPGFLRQPWTMLFAIEAVFLCGLGYFILRNVQDWARLNKVLNFTVGMLLVFPLYQVSSYGLGDKGIVMQANVGQRAVKVEGFKRPAGRLPNIYYILADGYTRSDTLMDYYGYDNTDFLQYLRVNGFQVADQSVANYNATGMAVASLLNMKYLGDEEGFTEESPDGIGEFIASKILNNKVAAVLRSFGYEVITIRSQFKYVITADADNRILDAGWLEISDFESALLQTTVLPRVSKKLAGRVLTKRNHVDFVLDETFRLASEEGPVFVLTHLVLPHQPFIYDRNGNEPDMPADVKFGDTTNVAADVKAYGDQVHYTNTMLRGIVDEILAQSETPPIIIIQSDHGLRLSWWEIMQDERSKQLEEICLRDLFTNLTAIYLPGEGNEDLVHDTISPVNTFRIVFDTYFGSELGLIDDRSFFTNLVVKEKRFDFVEVTGQQNSCSAVWDERFRSARSQR